MIAALISGGLVGLWRGEMGRAGLEVYDSLIGKTAVIQGRVLEDPDIDKKGQTVLRLSDLRINGEKLAGTLKIVKNLLNISSYKNLILSSRSFHISPKTIRGCCHLSRSSWRQQQYEKCKYCYKEKA